MKTLVAGGGGAIGRPLIAELLRRGHTVFALSRSPARCEEMKRLGAEAVLADVLDPSAVERALARVAPEIVIDELNALPEDPADFPKAFSGDQRVRLEGGGNLWRAAREHGVRQYLQQSSAFFLNARGSVADEQDAMLTKASPGIAVSAQTFAEIERRLLNSGAMEMTLLRYGIFYGPGTWYHREGAIGVNVLRREAPIIGQGQGVWSFIQVEDAAWATAAAVGASGGIYNIVDGNPTPQSRWLPAFAASLGAPPPAQITVEAARPSFGEDAVFYATKLQGASNTKAASVLGFKPRPLEWLSTPLPA